MAKDKPGDVGEARDQPSGALRSGGGTPRVNLRLWFRSIGSLLLQLNNERVALDMYPNLVRINPRNKSALEGHCAPLFFKPRTVSGVVHTK